MYAYNAALYCSECADRIMCELDEREGADADSGDSNDYPQWCSDDSESDCPEHCDGCGEFLGNSLTSEGVDYVVQAYREDMLAGRRDSVACQVWAPYYFWVDFPSFGECENCGEYGELFEDDDYVECCEYCLNAPDCDDCIDPCECSGPDYRLPHTD